MYHVSRGNVINRNCLWPNRSKEDIDKALNKDNSKDKPNQHDVGGWRQTNGVL